MEITRKKWGPASTPSCHIPTIKDYTLLQAISWLFSSKASTTNTTQQQQTASTKAISTTHHGVKHLLKTMTKYKYILWGV